MADGAALQTKLCINCRHFQPVPNDAIPPDRRAEFSTCAVVASPAAETLALIDGRKVEGTHCQIARGWGGRCGPDGLLFEAAAQPAVVA